MKNALLVSGLMALSSLAAHASQTFFPSLDVLKMHDQELERETKGIAPRFAVPHSVRIDALADKAWHEHDGMMVWSHRFTAPNAVSLNFGFSRFNLPDGASLEIRSSDFSQAIRRFTSADNNEARELWTPVIMSDDVVVELRVPAALVGQAELEVGTVGQGFRTFSERTSKSGSCNVDVACGEGNDWRNEINAVAVISTGGSNFCTGFMVNNTSSDRKPFFMTADHCRLSASNAASLVTYWNYQKSRCGGSRDGSLAQFNTGATFLAGSRKSDFTLLKLNQAPRAEWNVTYAGWDRSGVDASQAIAIHHPNTDEKSISFEYDPTQVTTYLGTTVPGDGTHVRVVDWDKGTTEPGSSGSPLFNQDHRVIGQLHGGYASCESHTSDYYGRFFTSWEGDGRPGTRLKDHLDAANTGAMVTDTLR